MANHCTCPSACAVVVVVRRLPSLSRRCPHTQSWHVPREPATNPEYLISIREPAMHIYTHAHTHAHETESPFTIMRILFSFFPNIRCHPLAACPAWPKLNLIFEEVCICVFGVRLQFHLHTRTRTYTKTQSLLGRFMASRLLFCVCAGPVLDSLSSTPSPGQVHEFLGCTHTHSPGARAHTHTHV